MKTAVVVTFQVDEDGAERVACALGDHLTDREFDPGTYEVRFHRGETGLQELVDLVERLELRYAISEERSFRRCELDRAAALHVSPSIRLPAPDPEQEEALEDGACPACGYVQAGEEELVVQGDLEDAPGLTVVPSGQMLVNEEVAGELVRSRISGCVLRGVRDPWGDSLNVFELLPVHTLPPAQCPPTRIQRREESCPVCEQGGLSLSSMLYYDAPVEQFLDVNLSEERFGQGAGQWQEIVLSQRMFQLLCEHGSQGAQVEPVVLV